MGGKDAAPLAVATSAKTFCGIVLVVLVVSVFYHDRECVATADNFAQRAKADLERRPAGEPQYGRGCYYAHRAHVLAVLAMVADIT